ncbi:MAG: hypothetical protein HC904_03940 [Blastochloris sp.]|nr:hypothetical protein [Blastochloris sp.]
MAIDITRLLLAPILCLLITSKSFAEQVDLNTGLTKNIKYFDEIVSVSYEMVDVTTFPEKVGADDLHRKLNYSEARNKFMFHFTQKWKGSSDVVAQGAYNGEHFQVLNGAHLYIKTGRPELLPALFGTNHFFSPFDFLRVAVAKPEEPLEATFTLFDYKVKSNWKVLSEKMSKKKKIDFFWIKKVQSLHLRDFILEKL